MSDYLKGYCPACDNAYVVVDPAGYIVCTWSQCPNPAAPNDALKRKPNVTEPRPGVWLVWQPGEHGSIIADSIYENEIDALRAVNSSGNLPVFRAKFIEYVRDIDEQVRG